MAQVLINDTTLSSLGDIIREANGEDKELYYELFRGTGMTNYVQGVRIQIPKDRLSEINKLYFEFIISLSNMKHSTYQFKLQYSADTGKTYQLITDQIYCGYDTDGNTVLGEINIEPYLSILQEDYLFYFNYVDKDEYSILSGDTLIISSDLLLGNNPDTNYTPTEMVDIFSKSVIGGITYTGNGDYLFYGSRYKDVMANTGVVKTSQLTSGNYICANSSRKNYDKLILNFSTSSAGSISNAFTTCQYLEKLPIINGGRFNSISSMFNECQALRVIPEDWAITSNWDDLHSSTSGMGNVFNHCYSLRHIPQRLIDNFYNLGTSTTGTYYNLFSGCYALDEVINLPVSKAVLTTNRFTNTFYQAGRLKHITFATNEDGTPITVSWKAQTIDLNNTIGYNQFTSHITDYNSNLTKDTQINDKSTYQALKDNPDSWTTNINYARYNHDSAVETINSLPDTSAYGTNTIKFKGAAGSLTDGGAINTLTAEEIAVAAAKGWTVTIS